MSSEYFQGLGASSSSIEADYLRLSVDSVHDLAELVSKRLQLNERQCQDLYSKLVLTVEKIQKLVPPSGPLKVPFGPALRNLYRVLEKAKLLVRQCCDPDWCRAAVFQIHNEGAFREILLEVGLCYNVLYEVTKGIIRDWVWTLHQALDLRQSSLFLPAPESDVWEDQETLKRRLQQVAGTVDDRSSYLARYLLKKLECISEARMYEDFSVPDALLWMNETEPQGTWTWLGYIGGGSGAMSVFRYEWLGILCARKEFHCGVADDIFGREAAILAQLDHPNIVKFFCCSNGPKVGECFIAMEFMEMSLAGLIETRAKAGRSFPLLLVVDIMTQIARGVCYLHGLKIAHRDLKPLNVVVTETRAAHLEDCFCVKLIDFGMSKTKVQASKSNTVSIPGVGTTKYRAPEVFPQAQRVARGVKRKVNWFQADAYSFAITCAELLSLKEPFEDVLRSELYEALLQGVRPELPGKCPEALVSLLEDCWATNPQSRPGFSEICSRLEQCRLQEFLRVSSEGLQGVAGSEFFETVSMKQSDEQSLCANTVSFNSDAAKEAIDKSQFDEEASPTSGYYPEDRPNIILSELGRKKAGFWSYIMSTLVPFKNFREIRSRQLKFQQKCEKFDVKPTLFTYDELQVATRDFHKDRKLGETVFGTVYKGVLPNKSVVAVKKSSLGRFRASLDVFSNEVILLTGMKHKNLVIPEGCCLHDHQWLVVYEYVENYNVSQILLDKGPRRQTVAWPVRLKILLGVAQGLHYLHALAHSRIIHRNIAARNVFLDRNLDPKIGDFCLALSCPDEKGRRIDHVAGTKGYMAPECSWGDLSDGVDVFSFGVLGLEIISSRHNWEMINEVYLCEWARLLHKENRLSEFVDPTLQLTDVEARDVQRVIKVCLMCIQDFATKRPSMARIVSILQGDTELDG